MTPLPSDLRKTLENAVIAARRVAEEAARASLTTLAVARPEPFASMDEAQRLLRRGLRAKARQLGDDTKTGDLPLLTHEVAYEQWRRMLFARFLAENHLLMHPTYGTSVSLEECAELAAEVHPESGRREEAADAWELAARYASAMLPGIFLADAPAVQVRFAPEGQQKLEAILAGLPRAVFSADDGLGWVYQFWQTDKKKEVNASGRKIGAADLAPVTQLFTEDYMVRFLLENSLGAWWAGRHPHSPLIKEWQYLRWVDETEIRDARSAIDADRQSTDLQSPISNNQSRSPAAGLFPAWPERAALITCMDPCGGSGHFVVAEFEMLRRMRMEEEGLSDAAAGDAVIRDNLFLLELDPRCTQIATFALALAAWRSGGYRPLPTPNIACSGIAVTGQLEEWLRLAGPSTSSGQAPSTGSGQAERLRTALERLHRLFTNAPILGSLINPADVPLNERMFSADYEEVAPLLERALAKERDDPAAAVLGAAAEGVAKAAKLLAGQYTLVATNVPYLAGGKQGETLRAFCQRYAPEGKNDLATVFLERCLEMCTAGGTTSLVLPQNWLFLSSYRALREKLLKAETWHLIARLGPGAFDTISGEVVKAILITLSRGQAPDEQAIHGLDVSALRSAAAKAEGLVSAEIKRVGQWGQLRNPDSRVALSDFQNVLWLSEIADYGKGSTTGDSLRFLLCFWEFPRISDDHVPWLNSPNSGSLWSGRSQICTVPLDAPELISHLGRRLHGQTVWGRQGIAVNKMRELEPFLYSGEVFDDNICPICPKDSALIPAIWAYVMSGEYHENVRSVDQALKVTAATLTKVPFEVNYWIQVAQEKYPDGLPEPFSNDPTQWLFGGHPAGASEPLQVAVARLLGYHWPETSPPAPLLGGEGAWTIGWTLLLMRTASSACRRWAKRRRRPSGCAACWPTPTAIHPPCPTSSATASATSHPLRRFRPAPAGRRRRKERCWPTSISPAKRWTTGWLMVFSPSTAGFSTIDPSSGTSGTAAKTASRRWSTITSWIGPAWRN